MTAAPIVSEFVPVIAPEPANVIALTPAESERVGHYVASALSPSTRRAYTAALRRFHAWCLRTGREPCPADPTAVAAFLVAEGACPFRC